MKLEFILALSILKDYKYLIGKQIYAKLCFNFRVVNLSSLVIKCLNIHKRYIKKLYKMYSGNRGEKRYMQKIQKPSKVLLVCVYDTVVLNITNQIVRAKFQQFGSITNILIFEKGEVTKLFVEFSEVSQASKAKNKLDGTKLCQNICKMTIYFSNFSNVEVTNQSDQTNILDQFSFNNYETKTQRKRDDNYNQNEIKVGSNKQIFLDDEYIMESFNPFTTMKRSKTDNPYMLKTQINVINQNNFNLMGGFQNYGNSLVNDGWISKAEDDAAIKMKQNTEVQSSILWFSYKYSLKPKFIYNVFSNFGNISSVTIKKQNVYIKFRTKQFAAMAFTYLNNTILMGNVMVLRQCPEDSNIWKPNQGQFSQSIFYNLSYDRFTPQRSITINPPANTIHISSIKRQVCRQKSLREIFSKYSDIDRIKILQNSAEKSMALIRFSTLEDSFNAMANLHNESFSGRKMQISFTKSKL